MARGGGQDLPRAGTRPTAKASRHGAKAKGFAPREKALLGESLQKRRTSERICPRRNALLGEGLPTRRAKAKGFAPRRNAPLGESLPTRRTSERICPAGFALAPRADERRAALGRCPERKTPLRRGRTHSVRPLPSSFTEKNKTTP